MAENSFSSRDCALLSHVTFSRGKTNLHDNRVERHRRRGGVEEEEGGVKKTAVFVRMFVFVDETRTSWQRVNSEEQVKLKHRLLLLL